MKTFYIQMLIVLFVCSAVQAQNALRIQLTTDNEITETLSEPVPLKTNLFDSHTRHVYNQINSRQLFDMYIHYGIVNGDDKAFVYNFNSLFGPVDSFQMSYAAVVIDEIKGFTDPDDPYGSITDIGYAYPAGLVITIDSVFVRCTHENNSGQYDKFQLQLVSTNSNGVPTSNVLWQQTDSSNVSLSPSGNWLGTNAAVILEYAPAYTTTPGQKVGMVFNYFDATKTDSFGLRATHVYDAATGRAFRSDYRNSYFRRYPNTTNISRCADWGYGNPVGSQGWVTWQNWNIYARIHFDYNTAVTNTASPISDVKMFPVPAFDNLRLSYQLAEAGEVSYAITDVAGREIMSGTLGNQPSGKQQASIGVSDIASGIYNLQLMLNGRVINSTKLMVSH
jgi:hypothetical protein